MRWVLTLGTAVADVPLAGIAGVDPALLMCAGSPGAELGTCAGTGPGDGGVDPGDGGLDSMTGAVAIRRTEEEEGVNPTGSGGRVRQCETCSAPPASAAAVGGDTRATGSAVERGFFFQFDLF